MPQVGAGETGVEHEEHDHGQTPFVGGIDGGVERGVVVGALGALHPVDDGTAVRDGLPGTPRLDPRVAVRRDRERHTATILLAMKTLIAPILLAAAVALPSEAADPASGIVPRFARDANPIALTGPARPSRYMEASGRRAAFLGREDGSFEAWAYPLKILHDFRLSFGIPAYADPIADTSLASTVDIRPEAVTVRYAHASFTVDATWLVPLNEAGGLVLLDVTTTEPLTVYVKFRPDLKPMWPAALGGQYSYWDDTLKAYVIGEGSGKNAALIGSPLGLTPPEQPAHNLPDAPSQFAIRITPEMAAKGLVPIVITASVEKLDSARKTYAALLASPEKLYRESAAHYRTLREEMTSIESPDRRFDLAFEWGKVALDKGFVCNPHLGCGLIAGLGPSGTTERPGFGWFFGGDTFINAWAISAYGDLDTVRQSLEFLRKRQRADGKMMHELSQGAGFIRWFEDYGYGYYHADTTPLYIVAVRDYVRASGDAAFARDFWPSMRRAYDYCASTDEDGDGLMDNTKAGVGAVETGALRRRDVLTDVYLGTVWTEAAGRDGRSRADRRTGVHDHAAGRGRKSPRVNQPPVPRQREPPDQLRDHEGRQGPGRTDGVAGVRHLARRVRPRASPESKGCSTSCRAPVSAPTGASACSRTKARSTSRCPTTTAPRGRSSPAGPRSRSTRADGARRPGSIWTRWPISRSSRRAAT